MKTFPSWNTHLVYINSPLLNFMGILWSLQVFSKILMAQHNNRGMFDWEPAVLSLKPVCLPSGWWFRARLLCLFPPCSAGRRFRDTRCWNVMAWLRLAWHFPTPSRAHASQVHKIWLTGCICTPTHTLLLTFFIYLKRKTIRDNSFKCKLEVTFRSRVVRLSLLLVG